MKTPIPRSPECLSILSSRTHTRMKKILNHSGHSGLFGRSQIDWLTLRRLAVIVLVDELARDWLDTGYGLTRERLTTINANASER